MDNARDYKARVEYAVNDATKTVYSFSFPYLRKKFVMAYVIHEDDTITNLQYGVDYTINNFELTLAVPLKENEHLVIYRQTTTKNIIQWNDGSILLSKDMNVSDIQQLHLQEEHDDFARANNMFVSSKNFELTWDALGHRITNVKDPKDSSDVVTKHYMESVQNGFVQQNTALANTATEAAGRAKDSSELAKKWATSPVSPDGVVDTDSPTGYTQSAKIWAALSKEYAGLSKFKLPIGYYSSVDEMRKSETAIVGRPCVTLGYYAPNDGGGAFYIIRQKKESDTDDGGLLHFLKNGLVAQLIITGNFIHPEQFGAYGDNNHDDSIALQKALDTHKHILADKVYKFSQTIVISPNRQQLTYMLIGDFYYTGTDTAFKIVNCPNGSYVRFGKVVAKNGDVLTLNGSDSYGLGAITYLHLLFQEFYAGDENCCIKILPDNMWVNENTFENGRCSHGKYAVYAQNETAEHNCEHNKFTNCIFEVTTYGAYLKGVSSFSFINLRHGENTHLLTTEGSCLYLQIILAEPIDFSRDEIHLSPDTNGYIVSQFASENFDYSEGHCIAKIIAGHIIIENQDVYQNPANKGSINISDTYSAPRDTPTVLNVSERINTVILGDKYGGNKTTEIVLSLNSLTTRSVTVKSDENTVIHTFDSTTPDGSYVRLKFIPVYGWFYEILQKA